MNNDQARHQLLDVLALAQEQMADFADIQRKRAALTARHAVADGTVEVAVDAHGVVTKVVIDPAYLEEFDFTDLGGYVAAAAQSAAQELHQRASELLRPLAERRQQMPPMSDIVPGLPDLRELFPTRTGESTPSAPPPPPAADDDWDAEPPAHPIITRR
ncbi:YbaB/EbfC family nucleoid-associated protein [Mycolicibacterium sp. CBMA 226]|uniref:YbaB/EbfC family nucleoid-associated protein n=1 Tax=Mycolicibacterium sp. CBMA 226 TaxID=2606611 RepID=UPI0012DC48BB|nr:YbaB/EbfC family nucleoid-associated protein [Mycolicibacterium sp. CBMA 226]MUL78870.1 YbaB/EbfC family nucleoid-associated protein [Mycolicibacterium sp. CBMA 226]QGW61169.1 Nucleoid-associated protein YbaB [Mycolicibacterium sp.]